MKFYLVLATFQKVRWLQEAKELTLSVLEDVRRRKFDERVPNTPARGAEGTAADLQATATAADPSAFDESMFGYSLHWFPQSALLVRFLQDLSL